VHLAESFLAGHRVSGCGGERLQVRVHLGQQALAEDGQWSDERDLDLGPEVNEPLWDGTRPDYDWAISCLADGR
jgi:hypothetical protein